MSKRTTPKKCARRNCDNLVTPSPLGRDKLYCSDSCRARAHRDRQRNPKRPRAASMFPGGLPAHVTDRRRSQDPYYSADDWEAWRGGRPVLDAGEGRLVWVDPERHLIPGGCRSHRDCVLARAWREESPEADEVWISPSRAYVRYRDIVVCYAHSYTKEVTLYDKSGVWTRTGDLSFRVPPKSHRGRKARNPGTAPRSAARVRSSIRAPQNPGLTRRVA